VCLTVSHSGSTVRVAVVAGALSVVLLSAACSWGGSNSRRATTTTRSAAAPPQWASYRRACANEGDVCSGPPDSFSGSLPAKLIRPLHFPAATGARCPGTAGEFVSTRDFGAWSLREGPVGVAIATAQATLRHGRVNLVHGPSAWLNLKTHFFSIPAYQGPFLVRAKRLDRPGPIRLGARPAQTAPLVVPRGQTPNGTNGWREIPYFTFVKAPGCYGWQVDGLTFSEVIVARLLPPLHS
jgi:hypothetical protein